MSGDRLESWKEIAAYLDRVIRTVQRWEKLERLPVKRHAHEKLGTVYASKQEIAEWWESRRAELTARKEAGESRQRSRVISWMAGSLAAAGVIAAIDVWRSPTASSISQPPPGARPGHNPPRIGVLSLLLAGWQPRRLHVDQSRAVD